MIKATFHFIQCSYYPTQNFFYKFPSPRFGGMRGEAKPKKLQTRNKIRSPGLLRKVHNKAATAIFTTYKIIWYIKWIGFHYVSTNSKKNNNIPCDKPYLQVREIPHSWILLLNVLHQIFLICLPRETRFLTIFKFLLTVAIYQKLCLHD